VVVVVAVIPAEVVALAPLLELDESVDEEDEPGVDVEDMVDVVVVEVVVVVVDVVVGVAVVVLLIENPGATLMLGVNRV